MQFPEALEDSSFTLEFLDKNSVNIPEADASD